MGSWLKQKRKIFIISAVIFCSFFITHDTFAASRYWVGGAGASINSASNWASADPASCTGGGAGVPTSADTVYFDADCDNGATIDVNWTVSAVIIANGYAGVITQNTATTWTINGNFTNSASSSLYSGSGTATITFSHTSVSPTITTGGVTFNNLILTSSEISSSAATTFADSFTVSGTLTVTKTTNSYNHSWASSVPVTITAQGDFSFQGVGAAGLTFGNSNLTLNMTGATKSFTMTGSTGYGSATFSAPLSFSGNSYNVSGGIITSNITMNSAPATFVQGAAVNSGTLTLFAGATTKLTGNSNFYNLTIPATAVLDVSPDGGTTSYNATIYNAFINNAGASGFIARNGTVTLTHTSVSPTITTGGVTFNNLILTSSEISSSAATTFADSFTVSGTLTVTKTTNSYNHSWASSVPVTITAQGDFSFQGVGAAGLTFGNSNLTLNMTGATKSFTMTGSTGYGSATFSAPLSFSGNSYNVSGGIITSNITMNSAPATFVQGAAVNSGTLTLFAGATTKLTGNSNFYNLTIPATAVLDVSPDGGTTSYNATIYNAFINNAGASGFIARNGTVTLTHTSVSPTITTGGVTFNNLILTSSEISSSAATTFADSFTVSGTLTVTKTTNSYNHSWASSVPVTITAQGDFSFQGVGAAGLTFGNSNLTLNMTGATKSFTMTGSTGYGSATFSAPLSFSGNSYNVSGGIITSNITMNSAPATFVQGAAVNSGTLTLFAGATTKLTGNSNFYNLTIPATAVLDVSPDGGTTSYNATIYNAFINNAGASGFIARNGTVTLTHTSVSPTITTGGVTFNNLILTSSEISSSAATTFADSFTVSGTLTVTKTTNSYNHSWASSVPVTITAQGDFSFQGVGAAGLTFGNSNLTLNMTGATKSFTMTGSTGYGSATFSAPLSFSGNSYNVSGGIITSNITMNSAPATFVQGAAVNSGTLTLFAGATTKLTGNSNFYNLTIPATAVLDVSPDGGTTSYNATIYNAFINNAGASGFIARNGTVTLTHTSVSPTITTGGVTFNNLILTSSEISSSAATTFADSFTVSGTLTVTKTTNSYNHSWASSVPVTITAQGDFSFQGVGAAGLTFGNSNLTLNMTGATKSFTMTVGTFASILTLSGSSQSLTVSGGTFSGNINFNGTGTATVSKAGAASAGTATVNQSSGLVQLSGASTFYALNIATGTLYTNSQTLTANSTFTVGAGGNLQLIGSETISTPTFNTGGTATYIGTSTTYTLKSWTYKNLTLTGGANTVFSLGQNSTGLSTTTINIGTLSLAGYNFSTTNLVNNATLRLKGSETVTITNPDLDSGTFEYVGDGDSAADAYTVQSFSYYHLSINPADTADSFTLPVTANILGNLNISKGTVNENALSLMSPDATGGTLTSVGGYVIHTFTTTGTSNFIPNKNLTVDALVVGGGGGGGMDMGGGGGGGGVIYSTAMSITAQPYSVTVGAGGWGAPAGGGGYRGDGVGPQPGAHQFTISATNGGNSVFNSLTAVGGGYGGSSYYGYTPNYGLGSNGGSGGGASGYSNGGTIAGGTGTLGQGYKGGRGGGQYYSGGGGGAGAAGVDSSNQPNGGAGVSNSILGTEYYWGGGGGGASYSLGTGGNGGAGGGGGGAVGVTTGGSGLNPGSAGGGGSPGSQTNRPGGNAGANTGGGGGGGSHYNLTNQGGNGGSGIVIIRYIPSVPPAVTGGTINLTGNLTQTGGTLSITNSNFVLNGTSQTISLISTTTINSLTKIATASSTLTFGTTSPLVITATTTLQGTATSTLSLRSAVPGTYWQFNPQATTTGRVFDYIDVMDSWNIGTTSIAAPAHVVDSGHNLGWSLTQPIVTVSSQGNQIATTTLPTTNQDLGGAFTFIKPSGSGTISAIRLHQVGSYPGANITNLKLWSTTATTCAATKPVGATQFGTGSTTFTNGYATTTGTLSVGTSNVCVYVTYSINHDFATSSLGQNIDLEISNPSTDIIASGATVSPNTKVNIPHTTMITNTATPDPAPNACTNNIISSVLSLRMADQSQNPTVYYLQNCGVWKMVAGGTPHRLTNPNLQVHDLTFQDLSGARGGNVKITLTISNMDEDVSPNFMTVTKTLSTSATVRAWDGN